jgi:hypothetical protein
MRMEVFYIEGCPNRQTAVERITEAIKELGIAGEVLETAVDDAGAASALRFLGSPTIQINGVDAEPAARTSDQFGIMCRTYQDGPRREGVPSKGVIREALLEFRDQPEGVAPEMR